MDPIRLSEMDRVSLMNRVDTKYVFNELELQTLLQNVRSHYRVLTIVNVRYSQYATLYFDSPEFDCYLQHHNGKLNRRKYRMRQYLSTGLCFLEIKHKNNKRRTVKRRMSIPAIEQALSEASAAFLRSHVGSELNLLPKLWTHFSRITLVDPNCKERVTVDCALEFRAGDRHHTLPGLVIAEVKQERDSRDSVIREQFRNQGVRPLRVSKYCLGTMLLNPQLKSNRFKPKLRAIRSIG
jgi:hypothetical protein